MFKLVAILCWVLAGWFGRLDVDAVVLGWLLCIGLYVFVLLVLVWLVCLVFVLVFADLVVGVGFCLVVLLLVAIDYDFDWLVDCCFRLRVLWCC